MRRREHRVVVAHRAELVYGEQRIIGATQDLCHGGTFVRAADPLPVGSLVEVAIDSGNGPVRIAAEVVHVLDPVEARLLGRYPGMGLSFAPAAAAAPDVLAKQIADFFRAPRGDSGPMRAPVLRESRMRAVVADGSPRLLERVSGALEHVGFEVIACGSDSEAYAACVARTPDVVLAALHMPVNGGLHLVRRLGASPSLAAVPVAIMSSEAGDLTRLHAYQAGVMDYIPKPFTVAELCIRVRRLARARHADRVQLRGSLGGVSLGALLTLFEAERKTGVLSIMREDEVVWLTLDAGRVVRARSTEPDTDSMAVLWRALDWPDGNFELLACEVAGPDEVVMPVSHLLLEHARRSDEARRGRNRA
jgi:DNA-binding response OmpR family regulator